MKNISIIIVSVLMLAGPSCKRELTRVSDYRLIDSSMAYLKIIDASPNFRKITNQPDSFNVYLNNNRISAPFLTYNSIFPVSVNASTNTINNTYAAVPAGAQQIRLSVPGTVNGDSIVIYTFNKNMAAGRYYTLMITDSVQSARDSSQIFIQDNFKKAIDGYINIRFIHAVLNDTAGKKVDLYSFAKNANIFSGLTPGSVTGFTLVGYNLQTMDTLFVRRTGTNQVLAKYPLSAGNIGGGTANQRVFTFYYKGDANLATGAKARSLGSYINQ